MGLMTATAPVAPRTTGARRWWGLALLSLPMLLVGLDINALFLALPKLSADLGPSATEQLWITDGYGFMLAGFVITMGTLGDRIGRRRLLILGSLAFGAISILAALSTSAPMLIAARLLLGAAGAILAPSCFSLIAVMFPEPRRRDQAIALVSASMFTGSALGPVFGGFLLEHFWWGSVFLPAVPIAVLLPLAGPRLLPEFRATSPGRMDPAGVVLSMVAMLSFVYGVKELAAGAGTVVPIAAVACGLVAGVLFVRRQLRVDSPLLDLRLLADREFSAVLAALVLVGSTMAGIGLLTGQYLQGVLGMSPMTAAVWFAPMGLGVGLGTMLAPRIRRWRPPAVIAFGMAASTAGCLVVAIVPASGAPVLAALGTAVLALGAGPLFSLGTGLVIGTAPPERAGSAASMSETGNYLGGALGMALLGSVAAGVYGHRMADAVPADLPPAARETLAGTAAAAADLPAPAAEAMLRTAGEAYTSALNLAGVIGAVVCAGLAVLFHRLHRRAR